MRRTLFFSGLVFTLASLVLVEWLSRERASASAPPSEPAPLAERAAPAGEPGAPPGARRQGEPPGPAVADVRPPGSVSAPERREARRVAAGSRAMKVSFRLDPRLTKGLHMGERWVSPPTYMSSKDGNVFTVDARAHGVDVAGHPIKHATWLPAEPDMVAVSPHEGNQVEITVLRAGRSELTVSGGGAEKQLTVEATQEEGIWRVAISQ
jgi:hypothetical protein